MSKTHKTIPDGSIKSKTFLSAIAPHFPQAIIAWDEHNVVQFWNSAAEKLFGYSQNDALSQNLLTLLSLNTSHSKDLLPLLSNDSNHNELKLFSCHKDGDDLYTLWQRLDSDIDPTETNKYITAVITDKTESAYITQQAKQEIQSFYELTEHYNDVIYEHDMEGNFTRISDAGAKIIGYNKNEFLKLNVNDVVEPQFIPVIHKSIQQKINGEKTNNTYEIQIHDKDNNKLWIEVSNRLIHVDGKPTVVQGIIRNIDDRKTFEINIKNSEKKFRNIFDTIDDVYYHINSAGKFDLISPSVYKHLGYKQDELIDYKIEDLYTNPSEREEVIRRLNEYGSIRDYEIMLTHKNGASIPFSISASMLLNDNGEPEGIEGIARNIRSRKEHEKILKTNEQRFRRIFESIQDVYFRAEDGIIKFVSPSCKKMLGYAPEEMIGHKAETFYTNQDDRLNMLNHFYEEGFLTDYEINYKHKTGATVTCSLNLNGINDDDDNVVALEGTLRDITARKNSDEALRSSEQRFRRIFESFQDTYYEADMEGSITLLSPSVQGHYGYTAEELVGKPASAVYANPKQREGLVEALQQKGYVNDYEIMLVTKSGELRPTSCSTKLVFDESGAPIAVQGILRDIAERKKSEVALRESEASFRSIFNSIPDAFIEMNRFDTIVNASPSLNQFSYEPESLIGSNISLLFDSNNDWKYIHRLLDAQAEVKGIESTLKTKNGDIIPISITAYKIFDELNPSSNIVCILRDISSRKRYEAELELARDRALEATRAKSAFLANMSHELRTPLNAIIGYSEMLREDAVDSGKEEVAVDLLKIQESGKHLLSLISDILDLSKIEAGKMEIYLETIDLMPLLEETETTIIPLAKQNNNNFTYECSLTNTFITADKIRLKQSLYNLLSNACKFTKNGSISLKIYQQEDQGLNWICFNITDTGIGITKEQLGKLFNEFTQADSTTTREFGGTGLGLVISQRFCQLMGGDIEASSTYGEGSTFIVKLPLGE